jgi:hypothetical protein
MVESQAYIFPKIISFEMFDRRKRTLCLIINSGASQVIL